MKADNVIEMNNIDDYKEINIKAYQRLVGKLMYILYSTRSDIFFAVGQLSKYNADLRVGHLRVVKRVIRYLKGIMHLDIIYGANNSPSYGDSDDQPLYKLVGYINNNYVDDLQD